MEAKIKITQRMLNKSIIDANKTVTAFAKEHLPSNYDDIGNGNRCEFDALLVSDGKNTQSVLRMYRRPRGDELLSVKGLKSAAKAGDVLRFLPEAGTFNGVNYFLVLKLEEDK